MSEFAGLTFEAAQAINIAIGTFFGTIFGGLIAYLAARAASDELWTTLHARRLLDKQPGRVTIDYDENGRIKNMRVDIEARDDLAVKVDDTAARGEGQPRAGAWAWRLNQAW